MLKLKKKSGAKRLNTPRSRLDSSGFGQELRWWIVVKTADTLNFIKGGEFDYLSD